MITKEILGKHFLEIKKNYAFIVEACYELCLQQSSGLQTFLRCFNTFGGFFFFFFNKNWLPLICYVSKSAKKVSVVGKSWGLFQQVFREVHQGSEIISRKQGACIVGCGFSVGFHPQHLHSKISTVNKLLQM